MAVAVWYESCQGKEIYDWSWSKPSKISDKVNHKQLSTLTNFQSAICQAIQNPACVSALVFLILSGCIRGECFDTLVKTPLPVQFQGKSLLVVLNVKTRRVAGSRVTNLPASMPIQYTETQSSKKFFKSDRILNFHKCYYDEKNDYQLISIHSRECFSVLLSPSTVPHSTGLKS
jgi:hypothetical protein